MRRFRLLAEAAGATETLACATSAIRRAANGDDVVDRIEAEAGVAVEVISGHREAELIFGAVRASVLLEPAPALCFDLGGGSVEIMVGDAGGLAYATSENLGVGRLTAEFVDSDPDLQGRPAPPPRRTSSTSLTPVADAVARFGPKLVIGSSGTLEDIGRMVAERREHDVPSVAEPAVVHPRRVPAALPPDPGVDVRRAAAPPAASRRGASTSSARA